MNIQACLRALELDAPLPPDRIHRAYRRMVKRWHPDQFAHDPDAHFLAEERLKAINAAYAELKRYIAVQAETGCKGKPAQRPFNEGLSDRFKAAIRTFSSKIRSFSTQSPSTGTSLRDHLHSGTARAANPRRPEPARPLSQFGRILQEKGQTDLPRPKPRSLGRKKLNHVRPAGRRRYGLRVDGFAPVTPVQPVRPISKINPIDGSD